MHTIHNIAFEIDVNHAETQISWEQYYVDFFQNRLLPKIEKLCDNWDAKHPNSKCSIDEIDIDIEIENIYLEELQEKIITKISDQLSNLHEKGTTSNGSVRATITSLSSPFDALVIYLKDGILPAYISVKIFKEWLGNVIQFTNSEKATLATLFSSNSMAIERMLSLLRNNYEKFAEILETNQKITKQYIKFEEKFFKKLLKIICKKSKLTYQETQANIWFQTLEVSSSLAQFSKTFIQLLTPKALSEHKRLTNINTHHLSISILQAIVQYESQQSLNISIAKIFNITQERTTSIDEETYTKTIDNTINKNIENTIEATTQNNITSEIEEKQKETSNKAEHTIKSAQKGEIVATTSQNDTDDATAKNSSTIQNIEITSDENHQKQTQKKEEFDELKFENKESTRKVKEDKHVESISQDISKNQEVSNNTETIKSKEEINQKTITENTDKSKETSQLETEQHLSETKENKESNKNIHEVSKDGKAINFIDKKVQQNTSDGNQGDSNTASKAQIDKTIFEKLSRNNNSIREIPLTTEKAGLILLNPFLTRFFDGAKLINTEKEISDPEKACMLLHFLATGNEEVTDVELTLEKICLGIPLDTIINYQTPLTEKDKDLCEELLTAVIQHWSVLKNSSTNTLRDMFLKREGNITLKKDSIKLIIERFAQDILLDKVPWNIGLFQLKWMDKMMHIEW